MKAASIAFGAGWLALAVAAGAFGAHALASRLDAHQLALWETAARYLAYSGFGTLAAGLLAERRTGPWAGRSAVLLACGGLVFSVTVGGLALGGPRLLGAVTPLGGLAMIAGFLGLALAARRD